MEVHLTSAAQNSQMKKYTAGMGNVSNSLIFRLFKKFKVEKIG
jgi:hypothetical protein